MFIDRLPLFPETAQVNPKNHLLLGGVSALDLTAEFGTPLYVFDEATLRSQCSRFVQEFSSRYPDVGVSYAGKAFLIRPLASLLAEEGLGLDVVSGGEMTIARAAGFPAERVYFHGNNKGSEELEAALDWRVGRVVVDSLHELHLLNALAGERNVRQDVLLRISPGVDPHTPTHHTATGILDSKFGFAVAGGQAEESVKQLQEAPNLYLVGLHMHLGSPIFELEPFCRGIEVGLRFAGEMRDRYGLRLLEFSPGGGFAIQYTVDAPAPPVAAYAEVIAESLRKGCKARGFDLPRLVIEPGRAIVGRAGVALYSVGATKDIPGVRKYVSVDGGMGDNIRPAIYGSRYEALVAGCVESDQWETVTVAGKYCESGDLLIKDVQLPPVEAGDVIAVPACGAYCIPMASNYNAVPAPAIIVVNNGEARLWRRRQTVDDLMQWDVF